MKGLLHSTMQRFAYPVTLAADEVDGGFVVTCRDLPEAITQGDTLEDAFEAAEGALEAAIEMRIEDGSGYPPAQQVQEGRSPGLPAGGQRHEARRILDPKHSTKVPTLERALHALGKRVEVVVV